jgi:hypothetical protein
MARASAPDWPAMMRRSFAAAYCGLGVPDFEREVLAGRLPAPVQFGGGESWSRAKLDEALDRILGTAPRLPDDWRKEQPLYGEAAPR